MMSDALALQAAAVYFSYGARPILRELDLQVMRGELLGVVGPNGAGKSTLLKLLSGALRPHQGWVRVHGVDVQALHPKEQAKLVAMVPQNPATPPGFTVLEMALMGRNPHLRLLEWEGPRDMEVALEALTLTGARDLADRPLSSLSGGERQRVIIARALAQEAPVLLLDEPTAHLDIGYQASVLEVIEGIRRGAGVTVVAAIHDLTLAAQYCDRVAFLRHGSVGAVGHPGDVLTAELISEAFAANVCVIQHPIHGTPVVLQSRKRMLHEASSSPCQESSPPFRQGPGCEAKEQDGAQTA